MRPRSAYEDVHHHIVYGPPYAIMIKFIGHYETHVDMFFHYGAPLDFVLKGTPLLFYLFEVLFM
jgi:hypothetical protein